MSESSMPFFLSNNRRKDMRFTDWLFLAKPEFNYKRRKELEDLRDSRSKRLKKYNYNFEHENNRNRI